MPYKGMATSNSSCVVSIHPRRRPRSGKENRSSNGDQRNFQVNGNWISANRPIDLRSTCSERSQAGISVIRMNSGRPELKLVKTQINIRRLNSAWRHVSLETEGIVHGRIGVAQLC